MNRSIRLFARRAALGGLLLAIPVSALALDWDAQTGAFQLTFGRLGHFVPRSGHPLATACAFQEASERAGSDPALASALSRMYAAPLPAGLGQVEFSVPYQLVAFGSWGNEIFTNSGLDGRASHEDAGQYIKGRYHGWLTAEAARAVYLDARDSDGYPSTYYLHSEQVSGKTQDQSFDAVRKHIRDALAAAITNLREAEAEGIPLPDFTRGFKELDPAECNARCRGLAFLGSIFHVIEDSSVSCSGGAQAAFAAKGQAPCVAGDGHTVVAWTRAGRPQVVALGNDDSYEERTKIHEELDGLYLSCSEKTYLYQSEGQGQGQGQGNESFDFNPKHVNASILSEVARAVPSAESAPEAAERIWQEVVSPRFAAPEDRRPLPAVGPTTETASGRLMEKVGDWIGKQWWQEKSDRVWYNVGRLITALTWRDGSDRAWDRGIAQAWPSGSNVARNAATVPGASRPGGDGSGGVTR